MHKFEIFYSNEHKWRKKIGPEVKVWLNSKLAGWLRDKPTRFDDHQKVSRNATGTRSEATVLREQLLLASRCAPRSDTA